VTKLSPWNLADVSLQRIALFGNFGLRVLDLNGNTIQRIQKRNQITNQGRNAVLSLLFPGNAGAVQETYRIWSLTAGTNNTAPTILDNLASMTPVWSSSFVGGECAVVENLPNDFYLQITKTLPDTDANGYALTEAGIFTRGDNNNPNLATNKLLYARQIHPVINKTATMTIQYDWQLGITIQGS
jgi:hypothetical protein